MGRKKWQIDLALKGWRATHWAKRIGHVTPFKQMAGLIASEKVFRGSFIPVDEFIEVPPSMVAPRELVTDFITRASHRTIIHDCPCRKGEGCKDYPVDLGCMLLGEGSRDVDPGVGRSATVEEGLAHLERALESGLLPLVGHLWVDKVVFGIDDYSRLLTVCFCCPCCCVVRSEMKGLVSVFPDSLVRLEGVRVEVTDECVGCGECVSVCPIENVTVAGGKARIGEMCLGCGSCARACSRGFIKVSIEPGSKVQDELRRRVEAGVNIS